MSLLVKNRSFVLPLCNWRCPLAVRYLLGNRRSDDLHRFVVALDVGMELTLFILVKSKLTDNNNNKMYFDSFFSKIHQHKQVLSLAGTQHLI